MDELTVTLTGARLVDQIEPAQIIAGRYFVDRPFHLAGSAARKDPHSSAWQVVFTFAGVDPDRNPASDTVAHQLEFRLKGLTMAEILDRGHQHAASYYAGADHVLVDTRATEAPQGRFTTVFTFVGMIA